MGPRRLERRRLALELRRGERQRGQKDGVKEPRGGTSRDPSESKINRRPSLPVNVLEFMSLRWFLDFEIEVNKLQ